MSNRHVPTVGSLYIEHSICHFIDDNEQHWIRELLEICAL